MLFVHVCRYHGAYKCPFGSTAVRTAPLVKRDEILGPGPAHYQRKPQLEQSESSRKGEQKGGLHANEEKLSYTFASTTSRLYSPPSIVTVRQSIYIVLQIDAYIHVHVHVRM